MRRENIGARPSCVIMELGLDIPDEAIYHLNFNASVHTLNCPICWQDIASYNKEQAIGDDRHNIITVVMNQFGLDVQSALNWVAAYHAQIETQFHDGLKWLPSWGPAVDKEVDTYVLGLANWPRCNDCWNFESGRYFGSRGPEVKKTRRVPLLPKVKPRADLKRENVVIPLVSC